MQQTESETNFAEISHRSLAPKQPSNIFSHRRKASQNSRAQETERVKSSFATEDSEKVTKRDMSQSSNGRYMSNIFEGARNNRSSEKNSNKESNLKGMFSKLEGL